MGCGGSTPVGSSAVSEPYTGTTAIDTRMSPATATATTTSSQSTAIEGTPIDYELDGEEMDMVELALFIAKTKREGVWIRSVNAVNLDGERDKFITALGNCINIESLDLSENYLGLDQDRDKLTGDAGVHLFLPVLGKMARLQKLMLANNGLRAHGIESLASTINSLQSLAKLDVGYNDLGAKGASALAKLLAGQSTALTSLILDGNFFSENDETDALVEEISKKTELNLLSIRGNNIKGATAVKLCDALGMLTNVTTLNISENNFGAKETKAFILAVTKMTKLTELVANNALDEDLLGELKEAVPAGCEVEAW